MIDNKTSSMVEVLTPIWERVLQRSPIRSDDDFFDLGGNPSLASKLFVEIERVCGRTLRPTTICQAPTIAAMATLWEKPTIVPSGPLVLLKPGSEMPPLFITHGIGGDVIELVPLARSIRTRQPIYGMQAKGNDPGELPFDHVEAMAQYYVDAIERLQPNGPYFLIGYSLGGLVTLEMAQRLSAKGSRVELLAMLDAYPHYRHLSSGQRVNLIVRKAAYHAAGSGKSSIPRAFSRLLWRLRRSSRSSVGALAAPDMNLAITAATRAWASYSPQFYAGTIAFVSAETVTYFPDPKAVWSKLANHIEFETIPGDHIQMINVHVDSLASAVSRLLKEVSPQQYRPLAIPDPQARMRREA
jgi:thioesterase domain-containing protein